MFVWSTLPIKDFDVSEPLEIFNQGVSDLCAAFASASIGEDFFGIKFAPEYTFAKACEIRGSTEFGMPEEIICQAVNRYGLLPREFAPLSLDKDGRNKVADWQNWPSGLDDEASKYRLNGSPLWGIPFFDTFDLIRMALQKTNRPVLSATYWQLEWNGIPGGVITSEFSSMEAFPHAFKVFGQKTINGEVFLKILNSMGGQVGDHGIFYMNRYIVNQFINRFVFEN